ncbi:MAG: hypothetical protein IT368_04325 [Candidatus Hydrogenedentes bacterium]|nr:hypothetical protein [Candidatus Hydrogenedentota bacterium]
MDVNRRRQWIWWVGAVVSGGNATSIVASVVAGATSAMFALSIATFARFVLLGLSWLCLGHLLAYRYRLRLVPAIAAMTGAGILLNMLFLTLYIGTPVQTLLVYIQFCGSILLGLALLLSPHGLPIDFRVYGLFLLASQAVYWATETGWAWTMHFPFLLAGIDVAAALWLAGLFARSARRSQEREPGSPVGRQVAV